MIISSRTQIYVSANDKTADSMDVLLQGVRFDGDEIASNWYNGHLPLRSLKLAIPNLQAIHADAFDSKAFEKLRALTLVVKNGMVKVFDHAFRRLQLLHRIEFIAKSIGTFPIGLFDEADVTLHTLKVVGWPNNCNLEEMFANEMFRMLKILQIRSVQMPQTRFRRLTATNFTSIRRLNNLILYDCGIEVIDENAFEVVGRSLVYVNILWNRLKTITFQSVRIFYESKVDFVMDIGSKLSWECNCDLISIDILVCPFRRHSGFVCIRECMSFKSKVCDVYRDVDLTLFCAPMKSQLVMRIIDVRLALDETNSVVIQTNFTGNFRIIFANATAMQASKCVERGSKAHFKCLVLDKFIDLVELSELGEIGTAEFISIAVIPILYHFAARPLHIITVRRAAALEKRSMDYPSMVAGVLGAIVGLLLGLCAQFIVTASCEGNQAPAETALNEQPPISRQCCADVASTSTVDDYADQSNYDEIVPYTR